MLYPLKNFSRIPIINLYSTKICIYLRRKQLWDHHCQQYFRQVLHFLSPTTKSTNRTTFSEMSQRHQKFLRNQCFINRNLSYVFPTIVEKIIMLKRGQFFKPGPTFSPATVKFEYCWMKHLVRSKSTNMTT